MSSLHRIIEGFELSSNSADHILTNSLQDKDNLHITSAVLETPSGAASTLLDVVNHHDSCFSLGLSNGEKSDLVEYLKSLPGDEGN